MIALFGIASITLEVAEALAVEVHVPDLAAGDRGGDGGAVDVAQLAGHGLVVGAGWTSSQVDGPVWNASELDLLRLVDLVELRLRSMSG